MNDGWGGICNYAGEFRVQLRQTVESVIQREEPKPRMKLTTMTEKKPFVMF